MAFLTASVAHAESECQEEANQLVHDTIYSVALDDHFNLLEPNFQRLQELHRKHCFDPKLTTGQDQFGPSYTDLYFDLETMAPSARTAAAAKRNWLVAQKKLDLVATVGTEKNYRELKRELDARHAEFRPAGVDRPSSVAPAPATREQKERACAPLKTDIKAKLPPVRNQGGAGWCFFYTIADLLSAKLGKNISASYLGSLLSGRGSAGSGPTQINRLIKDQGLCLEKTMPSNTLPERGGQYGDWVQEFERKAAEYWRTGNRQICDLHKETRALHPAARVKEILDVILAATENGEVKKTGVVDELGSRDYPAHANYLAHVAMNQCRADRAKLKGVAELAEVTVNHDAMIAFEEINKVLDHGQPAGVTYNFYELNGGRGGRHVSSVVNRRFSGGQCQFLVRNSWGLSSCTRLVEEKDACEPPGHFWVNATDLTSATTKVTYAK